MLSEWLQNIVEQTGIKQAGLSRMLSAELGRSIDRAAVNKMLKGTRAISGDELLAIERLTGMPVPQHSNIPVPLVSWISAGALSETAIVIDEVDVSNYAYAPDLDPSGDWIALRVDGRSMDKISPQDSIIFVNRKEKALVPNACYVLTDGNGGATYKRYRPPNKFEPVSTKAEQFETITFEQGREPEIIGRVRKTVLSL